MIFRPVFALLFAACFLACAAAPGYGQTAKAESPDKGKKSEKEKADAAGATMPAQALKFGAVLKENAAPELRKWIEKQLAGEPPTKADDTALVFLRSVEERFPKTAPAMQDVIVFLMFYLSYEANSASLEMHAKTLQEIDRDLAKVRDELRFWETTFSHPPPGSMTGAQREVEVRQLNQRLEQLQNRRVLVARTVAERLMRTDNDLVFLDHGYKVLSRVPPQIIRSVVIQKPEKQQ